MNRRECISDPHDATLYGTKRTADRRRDANFEDSQILQKAAGPRLRHRRHLRCHRCFRHPLPPIVWIVDFATALQLFLVLGRQWLLLPGLALEAIPGFGVLPFWLLVVGAIAVLGTPRPTFERR